MSASNGFTPTEKRILDVLADGLPHRPHEIHSCLDDELSTIAAIKPHLSRIRPRLRIKGQDIICEYRDKLYWYRQIRLLSSPYDGVTS